MQCCRTNRKHERLSNSTAPRTINVAVDGVCAIDALRQWCLRSIAARLRKINLTGGVARVSPIAKLSTLQLQLHYLKHLFPNPASYHTGRIMRRRQSLKNLQNKVQTTFRPPSHCFPFVRSLFSHLICFFFHLGLKCLTASRRFSRRHLAHRFRSQSTMFVCSSDVQIGRTNRKHERLPNSTAPRTINAVVDGACAGYAPLMEFAQHTGTRLRTINLVGSFARVSPIAKQSTLHM